MNLPSSVKLREVGPRDGFQSLNIVLETDRKLEIIEAAIRSGIQEIEATSFASAKALPQFQDARSLLERIPHGKATVSAMVFNKKGAQMAADAGAERLVTVVSASEAHNRANINADKNESLSNLDGIFQAAHDRTIPTTGAVAVAFGCPYEGEVPEKDVWEIAEAFFLKGADSVILADTVGMAVPDRVERRVKSFQDRFPDGELILHFHNNRGTAMANLLAALMAGAACFDSALGGIGGCPYVPQAAGNIPTEDAVYLLEEMGVKTGIDLGSIIEAAKLLESILGYSLPGQVMKSGIGRIQTFASRPPSQFTS